ncbi:MAG TPA: phage tail protein [Solirubrobacteraceae bacterium]|jgi:phage tail-like protein|nr:phage tail protein [Solirubrobacteraceae bacterium]
MAATDQVITGAYYFSLSLGGHSVANFKECDGLGSESDVVEHKSVDGQGKPSIQKIPGITHWPDITLKRGIDSNMGLWTWREQVIATGAITARTDVTITILSADATPVTTFNVIAAWPSKYSAAGLSAGGSDALIEEITLVHEGLSRA